jgi:hypothetical protein
LLLPVPVWCTLFGAPTCQQGELTCTIKNQAGLYFTERKPVCMSNEFRAITADFHMGNWMLALR